MMPSAERAQRWSDFITNGLPTRQLENWKYSDVSFLARQSFEQAERPDGAECRAAVEQHRLNDQAIMLVFVNGYYQPELSDYKKLPQGIFAGTLTTANSALTKRFQHYLAEREDEARHPFAQMNQSVYTENFILNIPAGCELAHLLHFLSLTTGDKAIVNHPRRLIQLGEASSIRLFEEYVSATPATCLTNRVTIYDLGESARLTHYTRQAEAENAIHIGMTRVYQQASSEARFLSFSSGAAFAREDLAVYLEGRGAGCHASGFYNTNDQNQYIDYHVDIRHLAPSSTSEMLYKGVVDNQSKVVFNGRVYVANEAQKTTAFQANHHLVMSPVAEAYSKPELEIFADDVKCKHGSTTGQIAEDALFYLRSRGMSVDDASDLLLRGFAGELLDGIADKSLRSRMASGFAFLGGQADDQ